MGNAYYKNTLTDWWVKEYGNGIYALFLSILAKTAVTVLYLAWLIKKVFFSVLILPVMVFSFLMWEGQGVDSFIHLGILLFPAVKIVFLAQSLKDDGEISPRNAKIFFLFVTVVLIDVFYLFLERVVRIIGTDVSSGYIVFPFVIATLLFIVFEVAVVVGFDLVSNGAFDIPGKNKEGHDISEVKKKVAAAKKIVEEEEKEEKIIRNNLGYIQTYGKNIAGHLPLNFKDDII